MKPTAPSPSSSPDAATLLTLLAGPGGETAVLVGRVSGRQSARIVGASKPARRRLGWPPDVPGTDIPDDLPGAPELRKLLLGAARFPGTPLPGNLIRSGPPLRVIALAAGNGADTWVTVHLDPPGTSGPALRVTDEERHRRFSQVAAIAAISGKLSHNLRNPLASVTAGLSILDLSPTLAPEDRQLVATIQSDVGRLTSRLSDALDRVRILPLRPLPVPVAALSARLRRPAPKGVPVDLGDAELRVPDETPVLLLDLVSIQRALGELVRNARQAIDVTGQIRLVLAVLADAEKTSRFPGFPGSILAASVEDSGPGIPPDGRLAAIRPFVTTRRGSAGLGLTVAAMIAELHGGQLEIGASDLGGARVTLLLPLAPAEVAEGLLEVWPRERALCSPDEGSRHLLCWSTRDGHFSRTGEAHPECCPCPAYHATATHAYRPTPDATPTGRAG